MVRRFPQNGDSYFVSRVLAVKAVKAVALTVSVKAVALTVSVKAVALTLSVKAVALTVCQGMKVKSLDILGWGWSL